MKLTLDNLHPYVKKRIFVGFLVLSLFFLAGAIFSVWYIMFGDLGSVSHQVITIAMIVALSLLILLSLLGILGVIITILSDRSVGFLNKPIRWMLAILLPIALGLARILKFDVDKVKNSFIAVNNQLVRTSGIKPTPEEILLLLPHCVQWSACPHKITIDVENCKRCGMCVIKELLELRDKYGFKMGVATGGTLARKLVKEYRPKAIVAVACERDLTSGIQDSRPLPVLGVLNLRPNGPCYNTTLDIGLVEKAILEFIS